MVEDLPVTEYVAECFWPDVDEAAVRDLDARAGASASELAAAGHPVRYLGSILMREDEVVLCLFDGTEDAVRLAAEQADVPFERILEATASHVPQRPKGDPR
jgi:Nickel responsive protein SCO4226-like